MAIFDFIKPKWKHSDPQVRLQAVREMVPEETERLQKIAITDLDMRVRVEAVQKITDEHLLTDFAASTGDSPVIEAARNQLNRLYQESLFRVTDSNTRKQILKKLNDEAILTVIAEEIDDPEIRKAAADKIQTPERLCRIAESHCGLKTGLSIVARLDAPDHLKRVARNATNKKVRKQAEEKLAETATEAHLPEVEARKEAELTGLCRVLEDLEQSWNWAVAEDLLEQTAADWRSLNPEEEHPLSGRFKAARDRIQDRLKRLEQEKQTRETLQSLCEAAEGLADSPSREALSQMADLAAQWKDVDSTPLPDSAAKALEDRFLKARKSLDRHLENMEEHAAARRRAKTELEGLCRKAEALAADSSGSIDANERWSSLQDRWKTLYVEDPEIAPLQARFEAAREAFSAAREARQAADAAARTAEENRLREICREIEAAVDAEDRAGLVKKVKSAQEEWRSIGDRSPEFKAELTPRFEAACGRFFEKQRTHWEQREWERWANLNQKEDLCKVVELLVRDGVVEGAPDVVRDARNRWRKIGPVSKEASEEIWNRFNRACDTIYGRCLAEKQALTDQLRTLTDPLKGEPPDDFNWGDTAEAIKTLQARWNGVGLLPAGVEKDLRREFQETCNAFFDRLRSFYQERDQARQENLALKTRLAEEAEGLADSEDWTETAATLKSLQRQWKTVGPVPKPAGDTLWERFQSACNTFFDRMKAAEPENLARKEALCRKAEEIVADPVADADIVRVSRELMDLQRQWKAVGPVPADRAEALWTRFREPCDAFFARRNEFFKKRKAEQVGHQARKEELVGQAEVLADSTEWRETGETLKSLQQTWKSIGPAPRKQEQQLWDRFRGACDTFFTRRNEYFGELDKTRSENLEKKEQLCIALEALARLLMPEAALSGRVAAPAEQLSMALDYKEEILVPGNKKETWERALRKVRDLQAEWKRIGPVPADKDRDLWTRFRQTADLFFRSPSTSSGPKDADSAGDDDDRMKEKEQA